MKYKAEIEIRDPWATEDNDQYSYVTVSACTERMRDNTIERMENEHGDHNIHIIKKWSE